MAKDTAEAVLVVRPGEAEALKVLGADVRFLCEAQHTGGAFSVMDNDLPYGSGPPPHRHDWAEAYFVVSGAVDFEIEGRSEHAVAGSFLYAPANALHSFRGADPAGSRMLVIDAPAHAAAFFRQVDREVAGPEDYGRVLGIGAAHGIFFEPV